MNLSILHFRQPIAVVFRALNLSKNFLKESKNADSDISFGNKTVIIIPENYSNINLFLKNIVILLLKFRIYSYLYTICTKIVHILAGYNL